MPDRLIEPPFSTGRLLSEAQKKALEAEALRANDRYVLGFLEEHNLCPYARAGRERGLTERVVHFAEPKPRPVEPAAAAEEAPATGALAIREVFERAVSREVQVVQIIFPLARVAAADFSRFVGETTEQLNQLHGQAVFASAALHPELPFRRDTPAGLISLFRRAPDPTLQWVRLETLDGIYRGRKGGTSFVDLNHLGDVLNAPPKRDLYDEIARANQATAERLGVDCCVELLAALRHETEHAYQRVLAG